MEDLVEATRWVRGQFSLEKRPLDLHDLVRDAAADAAFAFAEAGHHLFVVLDAHDSVCVSADRLRLLQVVSNLLRNAVKYTSPGGRITMALERRTWTAAPRITDTGRGIEANLLPYVFDLFSQAHPEEDTGLGIGLIVTRVIVLRHGGSIEARSEGVTHGSEFLIRLPLDGLSPCGVA